jgi:uncharacterized membrane protein HdeD (DUF308 family)
MENASRGYDPGSVMTTATRQLDGTPLDFKRAIGENWILFLVQGLVMTVLGLFAAAAPAIATLAVDLYAGWLFLVSGLIGLVTLFTMRAIAGFLWTLAASTLALAVGLLLILRPAAGILSLTLLLTAFFIAEGIVQIMAAFKYRSALEKAWAWLLLSGIVDLLLAALILAGWPGSAAWTLGLLVGLNLFMSGLALVMTALGCRSMIAKPANP